MSRLLSWITGLFTKEASTTTFVFEFREVEFYGGPLDGQRDIHPILDDQCTTYCQDQFGTVSRYVYDGDKMVFKDQIEF